MPVIGQQVSDNYYGFLAFLIIPVVVIIFVIVMCCCGRSINAAMMQKFNTVCLPCCWPGKNKEYDVVVCYSEYDTKWVKSDLKNTFENLHKQFKIHFMTSYHNKVPLSLQDQKQKLLNTKRIFLVVSENFFKEEYSDREFIKNLEQICNNDRECIIVLLNIEGEAMEDKVRTIEHEIEDDEEDCFVCGKNMNILCSKTLSLGDVEILSIRKNSNFGKEISFYMPIKSPEGAPKFSDSDNLKIEKKPPKQPKKPKKATSDSENASIVVTINHDKHDKRDKPQKSKNLKIDSDASSMDLIETKRSERKSRKPQKATTTDIYEAVRRTPSLSRKPEDSRTMVSEDLGFANFNDQLLKKIPLQAKSSLNTIQIINNSNSGIGYDISDLIKPLPLTDDLTLVIPK